MTTSQSPRQSITQNDVVSRLLSHGLGLGPFAFQDSERDERRKRFEFDTFKAEMGRRFEHLKSPLSDGAIRALYEKCIEIGVEKALQTKARQIAGVRRWQSSVNRLRALIIALQKYRALDTEKLLRATLCASEQAVPTSSTTQLHSSLIELEQAAHRWDGIAQWAPWKQLYRGHVWALNKLLGKYAHIGRDDRAAVIATAIKMLGIEQRVSTEAILKSIGRERKAPRRFAFSLIHSLLPYRKAGKRGGKEYQLTAEKFGSERPKSRSERQTRVV